MGFASLEAKRAYHREYMRKRHAAHPELARSASRKWRANNREREVERSRQWKAENRQAVAEYKTGIPHEVDHIIPLSGENVCGLHVQTNLQVIPQSDNRKKGNRFDG